MSTQNAGVVADDERARVVALLCRYPDLQAEELAELHNWFNRVATPLDLGMLAGDPTVSAHYYAYKAEHLARFKARDLIGALLFIGIVVSVVAVIAILKP
jgi:hypothetical protein